MHSDIYLGEDYISSNLKHWKYIKKERKNGRWIYYYNDPKEKQLENKVIDADAEKEQHMYLINDLKEAKRRGKLGPEYESKNGVYESTILKYKNGKESDESESVLYKSIDEGIKKHTQRLIDKDKEYTKAMKDYDSYSNSFKVKIRKNAVKTLNQLSNNIHNAKKFLKSIFK